MSEPEVEVKEIEVVEHEERKDPKIEQNNITKDHPRFQEIYGKLKTAEKRLVEKEEKEKATSAVLDEMRKHNAALVKAIERSAEVTREAIIEKREEGDVEGEIKVLQDQFAELKANKTKALKSFDYDLVADIDDQIMEVKLQLLRAKEVRGNRREERHGGQEDVAAIYDTFITETPWLSGDKADPLMILAAKEVEGILRRDAKWKNKPLEATLAEVRRRVEERFGWDEKNEVSSLEKKKVSGVEGVIRGTKPSRENIVTLTQAEREIARGFGMTDEEYARQKMLIAKGGK